ncbi:Alpha/Beta hydrolase protein [Apiosordaria backusii]|uniref:Alpha/Beta hydrolase protein n=1 Tax=Apiosordaria backusii TaxID=314023 RepID=A0AA40B260_9PEZI|nr:Alpha/Beta hydrolase protein [Apiosordaria backusii]
MHRVYMILSLMLSSAVAVYSQNCSKVAFTLPVSSENAIFTSPPNPTNETDIIRFMLEAFRGTPPPTKGSTTVSGNFTIIGTYCVPSQQTTDKNALQVLVHGITYGKDYWAGLGFGDEFNWHLAANARGYATLAIDRLGHGENPQRPDPLTVVQPQMHVEILHQIMAAVRNKSPPSPLNVLGRGYDKVIWVGHSYGSFLGSTIARQFPADADVIVLTGFSTTENFTDVLTVSWTAAAHHAPATGNLPFGYLTLANEADRTSVFYAGDFDPALPPLDFWLEDTITDGEAAVIPILLEPAPEYTKPVFVATGAQDVFFCNDPTVAECEAKLAKSRVDFFPNVAEDDFGFFAPDRTGHDIHLHFSAPLTYAAVHDFLDAKLA